MNDLNIGFYENLDTNFEQALEMSEKEFSHSELIEMLRVGNIPQKQIAALKLDMVEGAEDAKVLISNLTGCDGKIREAVALKINKLLFQNGELYSLFLFPEIFAAASIDINANICRLVIDSVSILKKDEGFKNLYLSKMMSYIQESFDELDKFIFRDKKYVINKQLFKLYWCLEALKLFKDTLSEKELYPILERTSLEREYTIREKSAQIVADLSSKKYDLIKDRLKSDENYYVRKALEN